jgi:hypothetical protein
MRPLGQKDGGAGRVPYTMSWGSPMGTVAMHRRGRIITLEGPSGAGKTTVVRAAARAFGWVPLPEAFERMDPPPSLRFRTEAELLSLETALLAEEGRRYREAVARSRAGRTVIADTGFLGPLTYTAGLVALGRAPRRAFDRLRAAVEGPGPSRPIGLPDAIVYVEVTARIRRSRARRDLRGHPREFAGRHESVGRVERRLYRALAEGPLAHRIRFVSGAGSPLAVARRVRSAVRVLEDRPPSRETLWDVLAVLADGARRRPALARKALVRHR